jgi:hypothetical protein
MKRYLVVGLVAAASLVGAQAYATTPLPLPIWKIRR